MAALQDIVTGDDIILAVTLKRNGVVFPIDDSSSGSGSEVKALLVSTDHKKKYMTVDPVIQESNYEGANWPEGLVVIKFAESDTADVTYQGAALVEIQVEIDSIKKTWFTSVNIIKGNIA